ncbi:MAG: hypothetical protein MZV63_63075 [Marinilabiliales bacterium]|nr:hypothetical protein [Marinilabiliales bacterium]
MVVRAHSSEAGKAFSRRRWCCLADPRCWRGGPAKRGTVRTGSQGAGG